ncbi:unnamed protein product [Closterium sp. Yama58-4]|nr:unnamed protein product [Closterium sp. Yama58-4]
MPPKGKAKVLPEAALLDAPPPSPTPASSTPASKDKGKAPVVDPNNVTLTDAPASGSGISLEEKLRSLRMTVPDSGSIEDDSDEELEVKVKTKAFHRVRYTTILLLPVALALEVASIITTVRTLMNCLPACLAADNTHSGGPGHGADLHGWKLRAWISYPCLPRKGQPQHHQEVGSDDEGEDLDDGEERSGDERSTRRSKKEKRPPALRIKRQWSDAKLSSLAVARWNTKDDLKAMQGKQGSQYWKKLQAHMVERDATWDRDERQMSNAWKRLEKKYLKTRRGETQSGGKAIKKKPWWEYVYHLKKHSARAKPHALDGGGAANVDILVYATVPDTNDRETSAPLSQGYDGVTPPPKRRQIDETATMTAAKLVTDAINSTNAMALRQLQDSTQLLVVAMNMAAIQVGFRLQMASPPVPLAAPSTTPPPAQPTDACDADMAGSKDVAEHPEP